MSKIESAISWMEKTANNPAHGYDQKYRWGEHGDYDCSSAVITAWQTAGVPVKTNGASYTGNMYSVFKRCGFKDVTNEINLKTGSGLIRGDVLLNRANHTAMYCGGGLLVQASINEKGKTTGGASGDQTGREFWIRSYYNYPWDYVLRYDEGKLATPNKSITDIAKEVVRGDYGNEPQRSQKLTSLGYDSHAVQTEVNRLLTGKKSVSQIADEVIKGLWGVGAARRQRLTRAGYNYYEVQKVVNDKLKR